MTIARLDSFLDGLQEEWMKSTFVERLESTRQLVDDQSMGSMEGANDILAAFIQLDATARNQEIQRARIRNTVTTWANRSDVDTSAINSIITALRAIRDAKNAVPEEPEQEEDGGNEGDA